MMYGFVLSVVFVYSREVGPPIFGHLNIGQYSNFYRYLGVLVYSTV